RLGSRRRGITQLQQDNATLCFEKRERRIEEVSLFFRRDGTMDFQILESRSEASIQPQQVEFRLLGPGSVCDLSHEEPEGRNQLQAFIRSEVSVRQCPQQAQ